MGTYVRNGYRIDAPSPWFSTDPAVAPEVEGLSLSGPPGGPLFFFVDRLSGPPLQEIHRRWRDARLGLPEQLTLAGAPCEATPFETGYSHAQATGALAVVPHGGARLGIFFGHAGPFRTCTEIAAHQALVGFLRSVRAAASQESS